MTTEKLTTYAANALPLTSFFDQNVLERCKNNAQALVLGATGAALTTDLTVSAGHKHDTSAGKIIWRQICAYPFFNNGAASIGAAPDECYDALKINATSETDYARLRLWLTAGQAATLTARVRVSHANHADTCTVKLYLYTLAGTGSTTKSKAISQASVRAREWVDFAAVDVSAYTVDATWGARIPLLVLLTGIVTTGANAVALHEIAFGFT